MYPFSPAFHPYMILEISEIAPPVLFSLSLSLSLSLYRFKLTPFSINFIFQEWKKVCWREIRVAGWLCNNWSLLRKTSGQTAWSA
jgi:hypothetical protein